MDFHDIIVYNDFTTNCNRYDIVLTQAQFSKRFERIRVKLLDF